MLDKKQYNTLLAAGLSFSISAILPLLIAQFYVGSLEKLLIINQLTFLIIPLVLAYKFKLNIKKTFSLESTSIKNVILCVLIAISLIIFGLMVNGIILMIIERFLGTTSIPDYGESQNAILILSVIFPPVCEEALFRGIVLSGFNKGYKNMTAVVISGILFGLFHMDFQRFFAQAFLGIIMGYLVIKTGSIIPGIIIHIVNNGVIVIASFIQEALYNSASNMSTMPSADLIADINNNASIWLIIVMLIISVIVLRLVLFLIKRVSKKKGNNIIIENNYIDFADYEQDRLYKKTKPLMSFIPGLIVVILSYISLYIQLSI